MLARVDPLVLNAGELRHSIVIQSQSTTPDIVTGAPSTGWGIVLSTRAKIATASAREVYQAQQYASQATHSITLRWPGFSISIQGGMRVVFGSRAFTIQAVENVMERNRVLKLLCIEVDGGVVAGLPTAVGTLLFADTSTGAPFTFSVAGGQPVVVAGGAGVAQAGIVLQDQVFGVPYTFAITGGQIKVTSGGANAVPSVQLLDGGVVRTLTISGGNYEIA